MAGDSAMDINVLCEDAWNASKQPTQPEYHHLANLFRQELLARGESIVAGGVPIEADSYVGRFERKAKELIDAEKAESDVEYKEVSDAAMQPYISENAEDLDEPFNAALPDKPIPEEVKEGEYDADYYIEHQIVPAVERIFNVLGYKKEDLIGKKDHTLDGFF